MNLADQDELAGGVVVDADFRSDYVAAALEYLGLAQVKIGKSMSDEDIWSWHGSPDTQLRGHPPRRSSEMGKRKRHTEEFKRDAVRLIETRGAGR